MRFAGVTVLQRSIGTKVDAVNLVQEYIGPVDPLVIFLPGIRIEVVVFRELVPLFRAIVGIAAAKAGAREVIAAEIDRNGVAALGLNAAANDVQITIVDKDITTGPPPTVDIVLAGDVFYGREVALRVTPFLDRCLAAGIEVLVGDPRRNDLPLSRLRLLAEYQVPDFGDAKGAATKPSGVFSFEAEKR